MTGPPRIAIMLHDVLADGQDPDDSGFPGAAAAHYKIDQQLLEVIAGHPLAGSLQGCRSLDFNLKGSGAFRAVYFVDEPERACTVLLIGPHENVYREAERRISSLRKSGKFPPPS